MSDNLIDSRLDDLSDSRILIVDDDKGNINMLMEALKNNYKLGVATDGAKVLEYTRILLPDLILLDIMMPVMDGYELCRRIKNDNRTKNIPIIFITAMNQIEDKAMGFELGAVDYITKPFNLVELKARVRTHLSLKKASEILQNQNQTLEAKVIERTRELYEQAQELRETQLESVYRLGRAAEFRDNDTGEHIKRMSHYCSCLARAAGMDAEECELIFHASLMHDLGKIGIPDIILLKKGKLTPDEWEIMKTHAAIGAEILSGHDSKLLQMARRIALTHHEKWDGSGYPQGLKGESIPLEGRIAGLCDVFDALTSKRPYKEAWPVEKAISEVENLSGSHFDPYLVKKFKKVFKEILSIKNRFPES